MTEFSFKELRWIELGDGWSQAGLILAQGDTAPNPASTKGPLYGPAFVVYRRSPQNIETIVRPVPDCEWFAGCSREAAQVLRGPVGNGLWGPVPTCRECAMRLLADTAEHEARVRAEEQAEVETLRGAADFDHGLGGMVVTD